MATVANQVAYLMQQQEDASLREQAALSAIERRLYVEVVQFDIVRPHRGDAMSLASRELLVRSDDLDADLRNELERRDFTITPVDGLDDRVTVLSKEPAPTDEIERTADWLRSEGLRVSYNYVTPTGVVIKGPGGPEEYSAKPPQYPGPLEDPEQSPVRVVVIDTGIDSTIRGDGWLSTVTRSANGPDSNIDTLHDVDRHLLDSGAGHGTFCAGIVQQIAPRVPVVVHKALDSEGFGKETAVAVEMVKAARAGLRKGQHVVINVSLGTETVDDLAPLSMEVALDLIKEEEKRTGRDALVIAAAGNNGTTRRCYPAAIRDVVAVAALTPELEGAKWSSRGAWVDVSTIGVGVLSTYVEGTETPAPGSEEQDTFEENSWGRWSGTSFAAPQVSGAIAKIADQRGISPTQAMDDLVKDAPYEADYGRKLRIL